MNASSRIDPELVLAYNTTEYRIDGQHGFILRISEASAALCDPVDPLLDPAIRNAFDDLAHAGWAEPQVLLAFWQALLEHWDLDHLFSQAQKTAIQQALNSEQVPLSLRRFFETALIQCSAEQWAWKPDLEHPQPGSAARVNG